MLQNTSSDVTVNALNLVTNWYEIKTTDMISY